MSATEISGTAGSDTLRGGAGPDLIYGFDPNGPAADTGAIVATRIATGLSQPVYAVAPPGDLNHLYIVDRTGQIQIFDLATGTLSTFFDISGQVRTDGEGGLVGLAFDPNFAQNGYFYVDITNLNDDTEVRRYQVSAANPAVADPNSEHPIITIPQPAGLLNHKAGWISFGPDGYLYVALGDGGGGGDPSGNGQNPQTLLAKMLRIDVHGDAFPGDSTRNYAIPPDNPFAGTAGVDPEIFALGLRNPFRDGFDRDLGTLYIGDVGQDQFEEIDIGQAGANYGWNVLEGNASFKPGPLGPGTLTAPIYTYDHTVGHAIIGGYIYRGESEALQGQYFFGDEVDNKFFTLQQQPNGSWTATDRTAQLDFNSGGSLTTLTSFAEDGAGNLYMTELGGDVFKLTPSAAAADLGDSLLGGAGDDTVYGGSGDDTISGDAGSDVVYGGGGANILLGGDGDDTLIGDGNDDTVDGGPGHDRVDLGSGNATVYGGAGDTIGGVAGGFITFDAGAGALTLNVTSGTGATINLGSGETVTGGAAAAQIGAAAGDDVTLGSGADTVNAVAGSATITLGNGDATVYGAAKDTIASSSGILVAFDAGSSPIVLNSTGGGVRINVGTGDSVTGGAAAAQIGASAGDDITLGAGADTVNDLGGDRVTIGSGNATVYGAAGDTIGGALGTFIAFNGGVTQFTLNATSGGITTINLNGGESVTGGAAVAQFGAAAGDSITLGAAPDTVNALAGGDTVTLGDGDATVYGAAADVLAGPAGTFLTYDAGSNSIVLNASGGTTVVNLNADDTVTAGAAATQIGAGAGDRITLGSGADTVNALAGNDTVTLGSGDATVYGASGDLIASASGNFANVLSGNSPVVLTSTGAHAVLNVGAGDTVSAGNTTEAILANGPADAIALGAGTDTVNIAGGGDTLTLGTGAATVYGGSGDMVTTGAAGTAQIDFTTGHSAAEFLAPGPGSGGTQADTVTNFSQAAGDRILESGAVMTGTLQTAQSSGGNTIITLSDGSTVTLVGVADIDQTFFQ